MTSKRAPSGNLYGIKGNGSGNTEVGSRNTVSGRWNILLTFNCNLLNHLPSTGLWDKLKQGLSLLEKYWKQVVITVAVLGGGGVYTLQSAPPPLPPIVPAPQPAPQAAPQAAPPGKSSSPPSDAPPLSEQTKKPVATPVMEANGNKDTKRIEDVRVKGSKGVEFKQQSDDCPGQNQGHRTRTS